MSDIKLYQDPILGKYIDLIRSKTNVFKAFYQGDPIRVPASMMPALVVAKRQTSTGCVTNAEDQQDMTIVFTVITDLRKDISDHTTLAPGINSLYDIIEGRDSATLSLKPQSLLYILRHNIDVFVGSQLITDINSTTTIDYGMTIGKRAEGHFGIEGSVTIKASLIQIR